MKKIGLVILLCVLFVALALLIDPEIVGKITEVVSTTTIPITTTTPIITTLPSIPTTTTTTTTTTIPEEVTTTGPSTTIQMDIVQKIEITVNTSPTV